MAISYNKLWKLLTGFRLVNQSIHSHSTLSFVKLMYAHSYAHFFSTNHLPILHPETLAFLSKKR